MGTPRTPSQKKNYAALNERLTKYVAEVQRLYDELNSRICADVLNAGYDGSSPFSFADYPELKKKLLDLQSDFVNGMKATIYRGTSEEWKNSNLVQDLLAKKVLTYYEDQVNGEKHKTYFQTNSDALKAFQERKDHGLNLSTKIWNQFPEYKKALEDTISTAIQRGTSAITLSKQVSQYLNDFPSMQKDYKERYGTASTAYDCEYRSIRLARSEINMAYRTAEQTRWRQFDFVKGYKICLSKSHKTKDVCDMLAGEYPKDFKWTGWHPNDMCYEVPIIASEEEYWSDKAIENIKDVPKDFKDWTIKHREYITNAGNRGTLPYFLQDNMQYIPKDPKEIATIRHKARTQAYIDDIQTRWNYRKLDEYDRKDYDDIKLWKDYLHIDTKEIDANMASKEFDKLIVGTKINKVAYKVDDFRNKYYGELDKYQQIIWSDNYGDLSTGLYWKQIKDLPSWGSLTPADASAVDKLHQKFTDLQNTIKNFNKKPLRVTEVIPYVNPGTIESGKFTLQQYNDIVSRINALFSNETGDLYGFRDYKDHFVHALTKKMSTFVENDFVKFLGTDVGGLWQSIDHLHTLATADLKAIPKRWLGQFNKYIMEIKNLDTSTNGYHEVYKSIEGAYNILKLSTSADVKAIGYANVSLNTPYQLIETAKECKYNIRDMAQRKFFDSFKRFVPMWDKMEYKFADDGITFKPWDKCGEAWYNPCFGHVSIHKDYWRSVAGRAYQNPYETLDIIYHEFGHAYDDQFFVNNYKDSNGVKALLDKYKGRINKDHGKRLQDIFVEQEKKEYDSCYRPKTPNSSAGPNEVEVDMVDDSGNVVTRYYNYVKNNETIERSTNMSDVLQAIFDDHRKLSGGHDLDYMQKESNQLAEFFAHMSEFYWQGNPLAKRTAPNLYRDMVNLMKKIITENNKKKKI